MVLRRTLLSGLALFAPVRALLLPAAGTSPRASAAVTDRRAFLGAGAGMAALLAVPPAYAAAAKGGSDGKWARRYEAFEDAEFADFAESPSGLKYKIVEEGFGVKPLSGQKIKAHYAGYLLNGAKFDASYDRGKPLEFKVGVGQVIKGWDESLLDMKIGEKRIVKIPSNLAYGEKGAGGVIPGGATLVFFVELVTLAA